VSGESRNNTKKWQGSRVQGAKENTNNEKKKAILLFILVVRKAE
jgi:hypothetical protein